MKLFAQHGFSDGLKTVEGLGKELIDGVIFSPRDITPGKLRESASRAAMSDVYFWVAAGIGGIDCQKKVQLAQMS